MLSHKFPSAMGSVRRRKKLNPNLRCVAQPAVNTFHEEFVSRKKTNLPPIYFYLLFPGWIFQNTYGAQTIRRGRVYVLPSNGDTTFHFAPPPLRPHPATRTSFTVFRNCQHHIPSCVAREDFTSLRRAGRKKGDFRTFLAAPLTSHFGGTSAGVRSPGVNRGRWRPVAGNRRADTLRRQIYSELLRSFWGIISQTAAAAVVHFATCPGGVVLNVRYGWFFSLLFGSVSFVHNDLVISILKICWCWRDIRRINLGSPSLLNFFYRRF